MRWSQAIFKSFTFDRESNDVLASVLASKKDCCYKVTVNFTRTKILTSHCECTRGLVVCSYLCAVLPYIHRNVSVTDTACSWSVRKKRTKNNTHPIPVNDFKAIKKMPTSEEVLQYLCKETDNCQGAAVSVKWLTSKPAQQEEVPTVQLVKPRDVIFTEEFNQSCNKEAFLLEKLCIDWDTIKRVAEETKEQARSPLWVKLRNLRITASKMGEILKIYSKSELRQRPSQSLLKSLHKPPNLNKVMATMWRREHETVAIDQFTREYGTEVCKTGLWLDECGYLGGSPDGLIGEDGICEVKCPYSMRSSNLQDVLKRDSKYFLYYENGKWHFDQSHVYYDQIQAVMYFTKRSYCVFIVWTPQSLIVKRVDADPIWPFVGIPILKDFYINEFVPYVQRQELQCS